VSALERYLSSMTKPLAVRSSSLFEDAHLRSSSFRPSPSSTLYSRPRSSLADVVSALERYLSSMTKPLAVRSSSLFEDAFLRPFAGVYDTYMLPNTATKVSTRLEELCWAIKMVSHSISPAELLRQVHPCTRSAHSPSGIIVLFPP
jgi:hypothetical protein